MTISAKKDIDPYRYTGKLTNQYDFGEIEQKEFIRWFKLTCQAYGLANQHIDNDDVINAWRLRTKGELSDAERAIISHLLTYTWSVRQMAMALCCDDGMDISTFSTNPEAAKAFQHYNRYKKSAIVEETIERISRYLLKNDSYDVYRIDEDARFAVQLVAFAELRQKELLKQLDMDLCGANFMQAEATFRRNGITSCLDLLKKQYLLSDGESFVSYSSSESRFTLKASQAAGPAIEQSMGNLKAICRTGLTSIDDPEESLDLEVKGLRRGPGM